MKELFKNPKSAKISDTHAKSNLIALALCLVFFLIFGSVLLYKYNQFGYMDWDLAIYTNAMWAMVHGSLNGSLWGTNFLTNHSEYISFIIAPIYALFPSSLTLIFLKLSSLFAGGYVLYLIACDKIGWKMASVLMILYFLYPANVFMTLFEFHFESLAIVFLFLVYYFSHTRIDFGKFTLCCVLACLCKENIPPLIFMFGLIGLWSRDKTFRKFAWTATAVGAGFFILIFFIITPMLRGAEGMGSTHNPYIGLYWTGQTQLTFAENIKHNLNIYSTRIFNPVTAKFLWDLFSPLIFMPLLSFKTFFVTAPVFIETLFSPNRAMHSVHYHYAATLAPFLFLASLEFIHWLQKKYNFWTTLLILTSFCFSFSGNWALQSSELPERIYPWANQDAKNSWNFIRQIPPKAGVIASFEYLSVLANRDRVFPFRNIWLNTNIFNPEKSFTPPKTQFALINWDDSWLWEEATFRKGETENILKRIRNFYFQGEWSVKSAVENVTLLEHSSENNSLPLIKVQNKPFKLPDTRFYPIEIEKKFQLLYAGFEKGYNSQTKPQFIPVTFYWKAQAPTKEFYSVRIKIYNGRKTVKDIRHPIGYMFYSPPLWQKGDFIKETFWLDASDLPHGEYRCYLSIGNLTTEHWVSLKYESSIGDSLNIGKIVHSTSKGGPANEN